MHPFLTIHFLGITRILPAYGFLHAVAALFGLGVAFVSFKWQGLPALRSLACVLFMAAFLVVGARLFHALLHHEMYVENPARLWSFSWRGFSLWGGFFLGLPAGLFICRQVGLDTARVWAAAVPALGVALGLAKAGCFLAGCCYGLPTHLPWGVVFPEGSPAHIRALLAQDPFTTTSRVAVHPTQLYDAAVAFLGALLAAVMLARKVPPIVVCVCFSTWYAAGRWAISFFRAQPEPYGLQPLLYVAVIAVGLALLADRRAAALRF